jgi:hypothetical protein
MIASARSLDEFPLVHSHPSVTRHLARSRVMASDVAELFHRAVVSSPRATLSGCDE